MELEKAQRQTSHSDKARAGVQRPIEEHVHELFEQFFVPSYGRFDLVLERGEGSYVWDVTGRRYLDLGGGIAVCSLGHANAKITQIHPEQSLQLFHVSS